MGSHRRKWGWWLVAAIAVAVAASLFIHRNPARPSGQPEASPAPAGEADSTIAVIRDTVYVEVDDQPIPVVRERKVEAGEREAETPVESVVMVPLQEINGLVREKSGRDIILSTQAPDRIVLTYSGKVDVPMIGEQGVNFSAGFKVVEVKGDRLVLQLDSGAAMNLAAEALAPHVMERLPAGLVDSFSDGRAVINLSAVPQLKKKLDSQEIVGFSLDEDAISLKVVPK